MENKKIRIEDGGRHLFITKGESTIALDKTHKEFQNTLKEILHENSFHPANVYFELVGLKEKYLIRQVYFGKDFFHCERWWGILPSNCLIELDYKDRMTMIRCPAYDTKDFSKNQLRTLRELVELDVMNIEFLQIEDLDTLKQLLSKPISKIKELKNSPWRYKDWLNNGQLSPKEFLTLNDKRIRRDINYQSLLKEALELDTNGEPMPYEEEWHCIDGYVIRSPNSYEEIVEEGYYMHNCIWEYSKKVSEGKTKVFFMREINCFGEEVPYIDIEVGEDGYVSQALRRFNGYPSPEDLEIVMEWVIESEYPMDIDEDHFNEYGENIDVDQRALEIMEEYGDDDEL